MKEINGFTLIDLRTGNATKIEVVNKYGKTILFYNEGELNPQAIELPKGNYEIIGLAKDLKWSDWTSIVESENDGGDSLNSWWYKDYTQNEIWTKDAVKSGHSLLKANNLNPNNCLILKKIL